MTANFDGTRGGETFEYYLDGFRLNAQHKRVFEVVRDSQWYTLAEIASKTGDPEASVSARLRDFRKMKYGGFDLLRERRGPPKRGHWEYRLCIAVRKNPTKCPGCINCGPPIFVKCKDSCDGSGFKDEG